MIRLFHVYFPSRVLFLAISETILIIVTLVAAGVLRFGGDLELTLVYEAGGFKIAVATSVLMLCMYYYDLYDSLVIRQPSETVIRLVQVLGTASVILAVCYYAYPDIQIGRGPFLIWIGLISFILAGWRQLFFALNRSARLSERAMLLGTGHMASILSAEMESRPELGVDLVGYVGSAREEPSSNGLNCLGSIDELSGVVERHRIDRIILAMSDRRGHLPVETLLTLKGHGLRIQDAPEIYEAITGRVSVESLRPSWLLFSDGFRVSRLILTYKRLASVILSIVGLVLAAPLMILAMIAIRLDSPGPAIFRQPRVGRRGKSFTIFKFRSMRVNADGDGVPLAAVVDDDRVTRVGKWLRRTRIDELPQLINILKGDMSFVGPRPFVPSMEKQLAHQVPFYAQRWIVTPGATGWAQVNRGYCATLEDNIEKLSYDLFYIKNLSVGLDCLIVFKTLKILLLGRGGR